MNKRYHLVLLFVMIFIINVLTGCQINNQDNITSNQTTNHQPKSNQINNKINNKIVTSQEDTPPINVSTDTVEVHFIDVGQGDSTLIISEGHAMLIDAGNNNKGTTVQQYLKYQGAKTLDYVIGTHPDADHIGGLDVVLNQVPCQTVILPDYSKDTKTYEEILYTVKEKKYNITNPVVGDTYTLGEATFTIVSPRGIEYDDANDCSVGILLQHGEKKFILTGDAEEASESEMLHSGINLNADVYKVAHHGSKTASTSSFLDAVNPDYAVISCGEENSYGHPHAEVLNAFRTRGIEVFRTDEQGSMIAISDGKTITWNCAPSDSWKAGEPIGSVNTRNAAVNPNIGLDNHTSTIFIINTNTKKFHIPSCSSVDDMVDKNKEQSTFTKKELIEKGYDPCKRCIDND
jgi:competence protein ComEC